MIYFREVQRLWAWLVLLFVVAAPVIVLSAALTRTVVNHAVPGRVLYLVCGSLALLAIWFGLGNLVTEVRESELSIRFFLLWPERTIEWDEIVRAEATMYSPFEYGGWGVRSGASGMAYTVSGNSGVRIELRDGKEVLIGSRRAYELQRAIADRIVIPTREGQDA